LALRERPYVHLAGQVTGVEGYSESAAIGLLAGRIIAGELTGNSFTPPPADTVLGALLQYVTKGNLGPFQPMNANLGLLPPIPRRKGMNKAERKRLQCAAAQQSFRAYLNHAGLGDDCGKIRGLQGRSTHEGSVNIGLTE
jgi:methylenetetrahydrofolate--tRNA-(uracil-5-)-methyltransferase